MNSYLVHYVLATVLASLLGITVAYMGFGVRGQGIEQRLAVRMFRLMAGVVVLAPFTDWPPYPEYSVLGSRYELLVAQLSVLITAVIAVRRRRSKPPLSKLAFNWEEYVLASAALVALHWVVARTVAESEGPFTAGVGNLVVTDVANWVTLTAGSFLLSQLFVSGLVSSLQKTLAEDWILAEASPHRRSCVFLVAAGPIALCVIPSLATGALLAGVLFRLAVLLLAWRFTELPPAGLGETLLCLRQRWREQRFPSSTEAQPVLAPR